ncbi:MAG: hypothetical protein SNH13_00030 [Rikenellaceae bacterium]
MNTHSTLEKYPWYIPAAIAAWREGERVVEPMARLYIENRAMVVSPPESVDLDTSSFKGSAIDNVIDTFLSYENLRIVAEEGDVDGNEVSVDAEFDDIDDLVTEELAEIYHNQGLHLEAIAIYTKLSLLNSEKSVYFAELISSIEKINSQGQ